MERIHLSRYEYLSKFVTYLPDKGADLKPNGLWYAVGNEWQAWCEERKVEVEKLTEYRYRYELDVDMSKLCVLDDVEPVMDLHWKYGYKHKGNFTAIDWRRVMADYSGIEVRNYHELYFHCSFRAILWLQNWDVSGGCIWDLSAVDWNIKHRI